MINVSFYGVKKEVGEVEIQSAAINKLERAKWKQGLQCRQVQKLEVLEIAELYRVRRSDGVREMPRCS